MKNALLVISRSLSMQFLEAQVLCEGLRVYSETHIDSFSLNSGYAGNFVCLRVCVHFRTPQNLDQRSGKPFKSVTSV